MGRRVQKIIPQIVERSLQFLNGCIYFSMIWTQSPKLNLKLEFARYTGVVYTRFQLICNVYFLDGIMDRHYFH